MGKTILLIPGWHEKAHDLRTVTHGRPSLPGLSSVCPTNRSPSE